MTPCEKKTEETRKKKAVKKENKSLNTKERIGKRQLSTKFPRRKWTGQGKRPKKKQVLSKKTPGGEKGKPSKIKGRAQLEKEHTSRGKKEPIHGGGGAGVLVGIKKGKENDDSLSTDGGEATGTTHRPEICKKGEEVPYLRRTVSIQ